MGDFGSVFQQLGVYYLARVCGRKMYPLHERMNIPEANKLNTITVKKAKEDHAKTND